MKYKVSVIIPVYNGENCLDECIGSLFKQTMPFENIEIILVDDNSKDNSAMIMNELSDKYSNVKTIFLKNNTGTASGPRNEGLNHATSDFIMFLDMDDYYYPEMCTKMYNTITGENVDVVSCRYTIGDKFNQSKVKNYFFDKKESLIKVKSVEEYPEILSLGFSTMIWTKIFRKSAIFDNDIRFPVGDLYEDVYFSSKFYLNANGIVLLNDFWGYIYHVRREEDNKSFSQQFSENMFDKQFSGFKKTINLIDNSKGDYNMIKSELIIDMTKIFLFTDLNNQKQNTFLDYMNPLYKDYNLLTRVGTTNLLFNMVINFFIFVFSLGNSIPILLSNLKSKI